MLSKIYIYIIAALGLALSIAVALMYRSKAKYEGAMRRGQEQAIKTERKAHEVINKGVNREREARKDAKDAIVNRRYFS